jgi:hypothetical protein
LGVAALAWLAFAIGLHPLMLPDEGRYVGVAWEMARSGNWIVPTEDGLPFFHKPPLFYWLAALSIRTLGSSLAAARLTSVCAAWVAVIGLHGAVRRRVGAPLANATVLVLVTNAALFRRGRSTRTSTSWSRRASRSPSCSAPTRRSRVVGTSRHGARSSSPGPAPRSVFSPRASSASCFPASSC